MQASTSPYANSRFNALKFGIQHEGPLPCRGRDKCRFAYCEGDNSLLSVGHVCSWELEYARRLEIEFRARWNPLTIIPDVEDFDALANEWVNIHLQRTRAMKRLNRSWSHYTDTTEGRRQMTREFELADLYLDRLSRRQERLNAELHAGIEKMRERAARMRPNLDVFETWLKGRKACELEASQPRRPIIDEFADGPHHAEPACPIATSKLSPS